MQALILQIQIAVLSYTSKQKRKGMMPFHGDSDTITAVG